MQHLSDAPEMEPEPESEGEAHAPQRVDAAEPPESKRVDAVVAGNGNHLSKTSDVPREYRMVCIAEIDVSDQTYQLRVEMRSGDVRKSLDEAGQLEPIHLLGPAPYKIIDGFRRCAAARALGWEQIEAVVYDGMDDRCAFRCAFTHNVVRKNLRPIDRANAIRIALKHGLTKFDAAVDLGLSEKQVGRYLALLRLPRDVADSIDEKKFTMAHALVLADGDVANVHQIVDQVRRTGLSVRQLKAMVRKQLGGKKARGRSRGVVRRDGHYVKLSGQISLQAPRAERERLAAQLIDIVALLQRDSE